ncbi:hypothetical protein TetV_183 [Tetraselmis virus 1]|uniref:Uncharacterized protein n=1 Tax=Tetraselmis virus 1 TaxID=2060617 RepID=A0A2P0VMY9_9VIRU|nr:hypothetical protein QJ968_gp183 [Tetraselmis virus 1]AUF82275.1 hypothetical protein TetV_183 [Tetraselmis virus 1]
MTKDPLTLKYILCLLFSVAPLFTASKCLLIMISLIHFVLAIMDLLHPEEAQHKMKIFPYCMVVTLLIAKISGLIVIIKSPVLPYILRISMFFISMQSIIQLAYIVKNSQQVQVLLHPEDTE